MNNTKSFFIETYPNSPYHTNYYPTIPPRRNSYQKAIYTSKQDQLQFLYSSSSSISSINDPLNTTRSLYTINDKCSHCTNNNIHRSISQPAVRAPDSDFLLENATFLLDSPVHALRPAHHKSRGTLSPTRSSSIANELTDETKNSTVLIKSIYRIVLLRSFASVFALASLFSIEVFQTSIYSIEQSYHSLLALHLSSSIAAFLFAAHASHIQIKRYHWKISAILLYDRCSQILIIFSTIFLTLWIIMQYFYSFYNLVLLSAGITGVSLSCMIIKTFEHLLQLSTTLPFENISLLTIRFNKFIFIYNSICNLSLTIGGSCLLAGILYEQWKFKYILIGFQSCFLIPCVKEHNDKIVPTIPINFSMYPTETKQVWLNDSRRYIFLISLILLTIISLIIQASTEWTTSIMSMSRRLSILYYPNEDRLNHISKIIRYRHYLFAIFIGFQEGYLFGNLLKFDVTCIYGLRHSAEMLILYGIGATFSSIFIAFVIKRITIMTSVSFTTVLHSMTFILLYLIQTQIQIYDIDPLILKYILFFLYGIVLGLWSTIAIHSICNSTKFSSSSTFAQSLAIRYLGRLLAYTSTLFICQSILFYINSICLLCIFSFIFKCYCCCNQ